MIALGIALATLGALCFVAAAELQHDAVRSVAGSGLRLRSAKELARNRRWLLGLLALGGGAGLHTVALAVAPLAVVQPIGVLALLGSTLLAVRRDRRRIRSGELVALGLTIAGVVGFVLLAIPAVRENPVLDGAAALRAAGMIAVLAAGLVLFGVLRGATGRCVGFAGAAAACYALVSVLTRIATVTLRTSGWSPTVLAVLAGIPVAAALGGWLIQHAYASGSPDLVLAWLTVGDPIVAVGVGAAVLGEPIATSLPSSAVQLSCAAIAIAGITVLATHRSSTTVHSGHRIDRRFGEAEPISVGSKQG
ncbi:MAG: hypothetical protein GEU98_06330 [Pseudonocardiaceae bacterium]|nr:hypothetical protein [Pseudonocardiaceae bacterium]